MFKESLARISRVSAINWITLPGLAALLLYIIKDEYGVGGDSWKMVLYPSVAVSALLFFSSFVWTVVPPSVIWRMSFSFFAIGLPALLAACTVSIAYLLVAPESYLYYLAAAIFFAVILWCWIALIGYRRRVKSRHFIEREFSIEADRIVVRQPIRTLLVPEYGSSKTFFGRVYNRFGSYLILGVPLAYPIQSLLSDWGGLKSILILLSILGLPLMLYILGRTTCGAYLWIYKAWEIQRRHGKPVVFDTF